MLRSFVLCLCLCAYSVVAGASPVRLQQQAPIAVDNASQVAARARLGRGMALDAAWSPVGDTFAVATTVGVWLFDAGNTGREPRLLAGQAGAATVAYSADGQYLASGGIDGSIVLWETGTGQQIKRHDAHLYRVTSLAFSADGLRMASADSSDVLRVWAVDSLQDEAVIQAAETPVDIAFSADGTVSFLTESAGASILWTWSQGGEPEARRVQGEALGLSTREGQPGLLLASGDDITRQANTANAPTMIASGIAGPIDDIAIATEDRQAVLLDSSAGSVSLWDGSGSAPLQGFTLPLLAVTFEDDNRVLARAEDRSYLWNLDIDQMETVDESTDSPETQMATALSADGSLRATGGNDSVVRVSRVDTSEEIAVLHGHIRAITALAFSPANNLLASASLDGTLRLWDIEGATTVNVLDAHTMGVTDIAFKAEGDLLASSSYDGTVLLWGVSSD